MLLKWMSCAKRFQHYHCLYEARMSELKQFFPTFKFALKEGLSDQYLPSKGSERATGWDVRSTESLIIQSREYVKIQLGFRIFSPSGWWLELRPRSSTFAKKNLHALYGVIDEDYEGQAIFACQYLPDIKSLGNDLVLEYGDAIGQ